MTNCHIKLLTGSLAVVVHHVDVQVRGHCIFFEFLFCIPVCCWYDVKLCCAEHHVGFISRLLLSLFKRNHVQLKQISPFYALDRIFASDNLHL